MTFGQVHDRIQPYRGPLLLCLALMLAESAAALMMPWIGGRIAGSVLSNAGLGMNVLVPSLLGLLAAQTLFQIIRRRLLTATSERLSADLRIDIFDHLQRLPMPFFQARNRGDLLTLLTRDAQILSDFVTNTLLGLLPNLLTLTGALIVLVYIDPSLTIPVLLGVPAFTLVLKLTGRHIRPLAKEMWGAFARATTVAEQNLSILPAIKSFTREDMESARHAKEVTAYRDLALRLARYQSLIGPLLQFTAASAIVLVLWIAGERVLSGDMSPGELVAFLLYAALLTRPVSGLADVWGQYQRAKGSLHHLEDVLSTRPEPRNFGTNPAALLGHIRFENVHFSYPDRPSTLKGISFDICPGETVALTGQNGAGKTTIVELLLRFQSPSSGRIRLDGHDISELTLEALRRAIAVVPQQVALVDGTIAENIRFGSPEASRTEIEVAAQTAEALGFISALPQGFETLIGERGLRLSGGERQRLALARALVKASPVLVLDEPTAMFDPEGEARFVKTARQALAGSTVILITHRPASLALADRVLTIENGQFRDVAPEMFVNHS